MLYNTLSRKREAFKPLKKKVGLYTCGPTIYDFAHIGNFRAYICSDLLKRYLIYSKYKVKHVMNLTDVDDKTIKGSVQAGMPLKQFTQNFEKAFFEDLETLNIEKADIFPKATEHIREMVALVKKLLQKKIAYRGEDGSVYYAISAFKSYGRLSHTKIASLKAGARVKQDQYDKEEAQDFALWKAHSTEDGDVFWETSLGKGRPGWHIECSAMSTKYLGQPFDIHAGGIDLVFPHHENEIAQSEGAVGKKLARFWFHNEHLLVDGRKMSKSLENFFTLRDLLKKGYDARAIRYLLLSVHYRQQLNFTEEGLKAAGNAVERLQTFADKLQTFNASHTRDSKLKKIIEKAEKDFAKRMDDDLNISEALAVIFDFVKKINKKMEAGIDTKDASEILDFMKRIDSVLGVLEFGREEIPAAIQKLACEREKARKEKDFARADRIRNEIREKGYAIEDTTRGADLRKNS